LPQVCASIHSKIDPDNWYLPKPGVLIGLVVAID